MTFIYINDYELLTKMVSYFNLRKVKYTTDLMKIDSCDNLIIDGINNRCFDIIKRMNGKRIIFILYSEEQKIFNNLNQYNDYSLKYKSKLYNALNCVNIIVCSLPYFKINLKKKVKARFEVIPLENKSLITKKSLLKLYSNYKLSRKKTIVSVIDFKYNMVSDINYLSNKYPDINFIYIGFRPDYLLSNSDKMVINKLPKNVIKIVNIDQRRFEEIVRMSKFVIFNDNILEEKFYLNIIILIDKQLIIRNQELVTNIFVNSKNCYLYKNRDELLKRVDKYLKNKVSNLSSIMYDDIKDNTASKISDKFVKLLK